MPATITDRTALVFDGVELDWAYGYDADHAAVEGEDSVAVALLDPRTGDMVAAIGAVTVETLQISDHGNVNVAPEDEQYLQSLAHDLAAELRTAHA